MFPGTVAVNSCKVNVFRQLAEEPTSADSQQTRVNRVRNHSTLALMVAYFSITSQH